MTLMKRIMKNSIQGIGLSCMIFLLSGMIVDYLNHGTLIMENWAFSRQVIGAILVGIGYSAPTEIYNNTNLPFPLKFLFHMGIGCTVYAIVGFRVGWIPVQIGWGYCTLIILFQLLVAILIWLAYAHRFYKLAKYMNEKIHEKEKES